MARLVEGLANMHRALDLDPEHCMEQVLWCKTVTSTPVNYSTWKVETGGSEHSGHFNYAGSLKLTWAI